MKVNITLPGHVTFDKVYTGHLFRKDEGVYVKTKDKKALVVYKFAGHMNAGEVVEFKEDTMVQNIKEATFVVGD